jgi:uncharacterized protein YdiU (UPF0061 family)
MTATETTPGAPLQALENSYLGLPPAFYARIEPTPVAAPRLLRLNRALAAQLGLDPVGQLQQLQPQPQLGL